MNAAGENYRRRDRLNIAVERTVTSRTHRSITGVEAFATFLQLYYASVFLTTKIFPSASNSSCSLYYDKILKLRNQAISSSNYRYFSSRKCPCYNEDDYMTVN